MVVWEIWESKYLGIISTLESRTKIVCNRYLINILNNLQMTIKNFFYTYIYLAYLTWVLYLQT